MEQERSSFYQGKGCQTLLIALGVVMVIGFCIFNLFTYMDSSRVDPTPYEAARWRSLIFGLLLFFARVFLFCMAVAKDGKVVRVVTGIIQGLCVVLCILSLLVFLWLTNGRYTKETINFFLEFKAIIAFLALTQGGVQRIFLNGHKIVSMLSGKRMEEAEPESEGSRYDIVAIGQCIFKIVGCVLLLDLARWFCLISLTRWWRTLLTMSGFKG